MTAAQAGRLFRQPPGTGAEADPPARRRLAPALGGVGLALLVGLAPPAVAAIASRPPSGSSHPLVQPSSWTQLAAGRAGSIGNAPPRGSSADLYGGSSADRYGGTSADKGGVAGERDSRVHGKPRSTRKPDSADRVRSRRESDQDQDQDIEER